MSESSPPDSDDVKPSTPSLIPHPLQGVPEILQTQVARDAYADGLKKPLQATSDVAASAIVTSGGAANDVLKTFKLFLAPFQLGALAQDRFSGWLDKCRKRVPVERQVESPPEVCGPIFVQLRFMADDNPMVGMYLNLLTASIDKDRRKYLHPSFVTTLNQLSPDEGKLFEHIKNKGKFKAAIPYSKDDNPVSAQMVIEEADPLPPLAFPEHLPIYTERLYAFHLLAKAFEFSTYHDPPQGAQYITVVTLSLSGFGKMFAEAVVASA